MKNWIEANGKPRKNTSVKSMISCKLVIKIKCTCVGYMRLINLMFKLHLVASWMSSFVLPFGLELNETAYSMRKGAYEMRSKRMKRCYILWFESNCLTIHFYYLKAL